MPEEGFRSIYLSKCNWLLFSAGPVKYSKIKSSRKYRNSDSEFSNGSHKDLNSPVPHGLVVDSQPVKQEVIIHYRVKAHAWVAGAIPSGGQQEAVDQ